MIEKEENKENEKTEISEKKRFGMLQKQLMIIAFCAAVFTVLIVLFNFVLIPMIANMNKDENFNKVSFILYNDQLAGYGGKKVELTVTFNIDDATVKGSFNNAAALYYKPKPTPEDPNPPEKQEKVNFDIVLSDANSYINTYTVKFNLTDNLTDYERVRIETVIPRGMSYSADYALKIAEEEINATVRRIEKNIELLEGESLGVTDRIMITDQVERKNMKSVQVHNPEDNYKLIHHLGNNTYYVEGAEFVPIHQEVVPSLITNAGYLLSMMRVAAKDIDDGNEILADLEAFGLHPENPASYFIVTKTDDIWYKIIIGDKIPTTGGYYVMYEDADGLRPAIYIVDTTIEDTILSTRYSILLPAIVEPIRMNESYLIDNFRFYKGRDLFVHIYEGPIPEDSEAFVNHVMGYPAPYMVSDNYSSLLNFITNIMGDRVVYALGINDEELPDEIITKYGFDEYTAKITFDFKDKNYYFVFSKPNEKGNYYVLTEFYSIVEVPPEKLKIEGIPQPFLEWDILKFIDRPIFSYNINDVASIEIKVPGKNDAFFTIAPDPNSDKERDRIVTGNGKDLIVDGGFRDFYYSILSIDLLDFIALDSETDVYAQKEPMLQMIITMNDGFIRDYKFYFVEENTRRCFYTINGSGDFYVLRDKVLKLMKDTDLILQNLPIDREAPE